MKVELMTIQDCPHVANARDLLRSCLFDLGLAVHVDERLGDYPSPSVLINGRDVMGDPGYRVASCRLDVPTRAAILRALQVR